MTDRGRPMTRRKPKSKKQNAAAGSRLAALEAEVQDLREQLTRERQHFDGALDAVAESRSKLESSRERYVDLYDTAPVGYVLLDRNGFIHEANLTAARMLAVPRERLSPSFLAWFVVKEDHRTVLQHLHRCWRSAGDEEVTSEVKLACADGQLCDIVLTSRTQPASSKVSAKVRFRTALVDITERKQAEAALRESEERFRSLFEHAASGMAQIDATGRFVNVNDRFCQITGYSREELLNKLGPLDLDHPDDAEADRKRIADFFHAKLPYLFVEKRYVRKAGNIVWVRVTVAPIRDAHGNIGATVAVIEDITDRKRTEEALCESESRFRALAQASSDVVYRMSPDWTEMRHLVGRDFIPDTDQPSETWLQRYIHPDDQAHVMSVINEAIRTKGVFKLEHRVLRVDGTLGWTFSRAIPILDAAGEIIEWFGMASDVSARKWAEEALQKAQELLRDTEKIDHVGGWEFDIDTKKQIWTDEVYHIHEVSRDFEPTVDNGIAFYAPESKSTIERVVQQAIELGESFDVELEFITAKGNRRWVHAIGRRDVEGHRVHGFFQDITDRKRTEEALRDSEERFAKAFRASPNPIEITEVSTGRCIEVNEACLRLFGFCREEVIGNTMLMLGIWPNQEDRARLVERLKAGEPVRNLELRFKTKSGELRHMLVSSDLAELSGTLCLITVGNDITERKQAEDQARRVADDLAEAQRVAKFGSWRFDVASDRVVLSDQLCRMFNVEPSPLGEPYESFLALVLPDDRPGVVQANIEARANGTAFDIEFRIMTADGSVKAMRELGYASKDAADRVVGLFGTVQDITERKRAEEKLRVNEELLRAVMNSLTDHIAVLDKQGAIIAVNEAWVRFSLANNLERSPDQWSGVNYFDVCREAVNHDEMAWHVLQGLEGVRDGSRPFFGFEYPCHSETEQRWFNLKVTPLSGTERGLVVYHENITERKHAEVVLQEARTMLEQRVRERTAQLAEANERWDWVVRATNDGVWDWDLVHDTAYFSPRWKEMHGFQTSDQPESTKEWQTRIHPEDRQSVLDRLEAYLRGEAGEFWEEYRIQRKDGTYIWVLDRGVAIKDEQGRAVRMVGAETDITWRKEVEQALRFREQQFHTLADNVPAHFAYIDRSRRYQFLNKHCEALFQRPAEALQGMSVQDLLGPEDYAQLKPFLDQALAGEPVSFEYTRQLPGDGTCSLSGQYVPDRDDQGNVRGVLALMTDITTLKSNESLLRAREAQLRDLGGKLLRAQEEERRRISRDLHDDVMQRMAHQLHPSVLEFGGLETALREQVNDFGARTGVSAEFIAKGVPKDIPLDQATCLFRIVQEGLQNVQKHAEATTVLVRLMRTGRGLGLCIHDDGRGIEKNDEASGRRGLGLTSMAERVGMLKGVFRIRAKPGDGTELHAWVPLEDVKCET